MDKNLILKSDSLLDSGNLWKSTNICDFKDIKCMTKGSNNFFKLLVAGIKGLTKPLDPLQVNDIRGELGNVKYHLSNVTLIGFSTCEIKKFFLTIEESTYEHDLLCSKLVVNYNYEAKPNEGSSEITENGSGTVTIVDYDMKLKGKYGKKFVGNDPVSHFFIVSHYIDTIPKGKVTVETKSNHNPDKSNFAQVLAHAQNLNEIDEKYIRSPIMDTFTTVIMKNIDTLVRTMRPEAIFPKED